jgi:hypothetical protein
MSLSSLCRIPAPCLSAAWSRRNPLHGSITPCISIQSRSNPSSRRPVALGRRGGVEQRAPCPVCGIPVQLAFSHHHHHWYPTRAALVLGLSLRALGTGHWFWLGRCNRRILPPPPFLRPYFFSFHSCWHTSFNLSSTYNCRYNTKRLRALTEDNTSTRLRREKKEILGADRTSCWVSQANVPSDRGILVLGEPIRTASPNRQPGIQQVSNHSGSSETSISARPSR